MPNETTTERPHDDALPDVLMRVVSELYDVAHLIERIEPQLTSANGQALLEATASMKVLQGIDLAVQKTRGLAEFIDTFTATIPETCSVDISTALSLVKLADMQKALGAIHPRFGHSQPLSRASGDFEAF